MATVSTWTEGILLSLAVIIVLGIVVVEFNSMYNKSYVIPFTDNSNAEQSFIRYTNSSQGRIQGGEVVYSAEQGITLKTSYDLAKDVINIVWNFLSGGWISQIASAMQLGAAGMAIANILRVLYILSLIAAVLYVLFKVIL